jgi:hypothetical protein
LLGEEDRGERVKNGNLHKTNIFVSAPEVAVLGDRVERVSAVEIS